MSTLQTSALLGSRNTWCSKMGLGSFGNSHSPSKEAIGGDASAPAGKGTGSGEVNLFASVDSAGDLRHRGALFGNGIGFVW